MATRASDLTWLSAPARTIVPIAREHIAGFHAALDEIAQEGRFLALLEAPTLGQTRRFVLDSLRNGAVHLVALADDHVVGWCDLRPKAASTQRHSAVLGMGVVQRFRGQGLGTALLGASLRGARERGFRRVELVVRADNTGAIALYGRFGFTVEGTLRRYLCVDGADHDALLMARLA
jgi:ribosomal protein S18 acetylase RimI-like enzyme